MNAIRLLRRFSLFPSCAAARPTGPDLRVRNGSARGAALQVPNVRNIIVVSRLGSPGTTSRLPRTVLQLSSISSRRVGVRFLSRGSRRSSSPSVPLHVERQVVAPRKRSLTKMALERLLARVFAIVPRQLVRSCEFPRAAFPRALVRLLACNR